MSSFFGNSDPTDSTNTAASTQAPVFTGTTTREQFTPATGASTVPSGSGGPTADGGGSGGSNGAAPAKAPGSAAPATSAAGGGAQAPQFTNLSDYLHDQSQQQIQQQTAGLTQSANSASNSANAAGNAATQSVNSGAAAGTDTGSIVQTASTASTAGGAPHFPGRNLFVPSPKAPTAPSTFPRTPPVNPPTVAGQTSTITPGQSIPGDPLIRPPPVAGPTVHTLSTPTVNDAPSLVTTGTPTSATYDFSKANLGGYTGPSAAEAQNAFTRAGAVANAASQNAAALQSGHAMGNAWDNALETQTPAWAQLQAAVSGDNQAAANVAAQQQGAAQAVQNAQNTSGTNVAVQRKQLGDISSSLSSEAAATTSAATTIQSLVEKGGDPAAWVSDPADVAAFEQLGIPASVVQSYVQGLKDGSLNTSEVNADLAGYVSAATSSAFTGYNPTTAAEMNQINALEGNGQTVSAGSALPTSINSGAAQSQQNQAGLSSLAPAIAQYSQLSNSAQTNPVAVIGIRTNVLTTISGLLAQGYTMDDIIKQTGVSLGQMANIIEGNNHGGGQSPASLTAAVPNALKQIQAAQAARNGAPETVSSLMGLAQKPDNYK